jgi:hypothetical protein
MPLLYVIGFPLNPISGKGSNFFLVLMSYRLTKARLIKFPMHPKSIKALAGALLICTYTTKLFAYRALLAAIRYGLGRSF